MAGLIQQFSIAAGSSGVGFDPTGYLAMSGDIFGCHNQGDDTGIWWVEAGDIAKHPTIQRTTLTTKNYLG